MVLSVGFKNFRNLCESVQDLGKGVNLIYGDNAQGKTNFLESIYLCATGRSQRTVNDREMIRFGEKDAYIHLNMSNCDQIDINLKKDQKKGIAINKIPIKKLGDLFGYLHVIIFTPEDMKLVKAGPVERRQFMDMELCQLSKLYYHEIQQYYRVLKQRNILLKMIQSKNSLKDTLHVWNEQLMDHGLKIMEKREKFIYEISEAASKIHNEITGSNEDLTIQYKANVQPDEFREKLERSADRDTVVGNTSVGIHKDDLMFSINGNDAKTYASQGQQRTVSLATKLAEIYIIKKNRKENPVLLLDDVFSELDGNRQKYFHKNIEESQTIITCTGLNEVINNLPGDVSIYHMSRGKMRRQ